MRKDKQKKRKKDRPKESGWVNSDLLRMAVDLEAQAVEVSDEEDWHAPRRQDLRQAAICLRQAFQHLDAIPRLTR